MCLKILGYCTKEPAGTLQPSENSREETNKITLQCRYVRTYVGLDCSRKHKYTNVRGIFFAVAQTILKGLSKKYMYVRRAFSAAVH